MIFLTRRRLEEVVGKVVEEKVLGALQRIEKKLDQNAKQGEQIMATLDDVLAKVADERTQIASFKVLFAGLKQQLADALASENLSPATQAKVDAVFAGVSENDQAVVDAINSNTATAATPPAATAPATS
jgi:hypothetical protein